MRERRGEIRKIKIKEIRAKKTELKIEVRKTRLEEKY